ncbi:hypothetical protein DDB_G0278361 [Dictyostelium discoideum AX4]|uniref:Uncharacterized protein n=1 Tax=Dictyostelium discoideum TaxID=44689 RepID=Q54Y88_DICDI|nr:hypothetical protein DDB_G0278361 [Dictyostelium discoideum AX4]EAL68353.1 hypothetical protein DDB_G0278361 [Dictyostelium discoideum AX4]|eukprot:XP_642314.1 hypothetical protein DDB_G0278361 [Dictyostelium discoideum AX4]
MVSIIVPSLVKESSRESLLATTIDNSTLSTTPSPSPKLPTLESVVTAKPLLHHHLLLLQPPLLKLIKKFGLKLIKILHHQLHL